MKRASLLIVEDEAIVALDLKQQLVQLGYDVVGTAASGEQAIAQVAAQRPDLVLMDVRLQGAMDGIQAAQQIRLRHDVPMVFLTSHSDDETVRRAAQTGPYGYLTKPYQIKELRAGIEVALTKARMERQLREADRWFAHTLQCVSDGVIVTDVQARVRFINPAAERLTGWLLDQALGQDVADVVRLGAAANADAASAGDAAERVHEVLREGRAASVAYARALHSRNGLARVVDESAGPVNDDAGQRLGAVLVLRDAAPRVAQEALLRASEERFRAAFDYAPLGMALVSFGGEFIQVNDALCRLLGASRESLREQCHDAFTAVADREHEAQRLRELTGLPAGVVQFEKRYQRPEGGEPIWTLVSVSLLHDGGVPSCHLYQVHDLSEQKRAAAHLAALAEERLKREASDLASEAKTEFLSRVSHEMRTPLNAVIGFAQLLQMQTGSQNTPADAQTNEQKTLTFATHIRTAGEHLLALVSDLMDLNRVAQGTLQLASEALVLAQVVDEALQLLQGDALSHGVAVQAQLDGGVCVLADRQRLRQVLLNVVSNAIKYNRQGGTVLIHAAVLSASSSVVLLVEDQGIGMTEEQLQRLFQPFERLGAERTLVPGTGLGLVIARSMVEEMGGTLTVQSQPRVGTTVTLSLLQAPSAAPTRPAQ